MSQKPLRGVPGTPTRQWPTLPVPIDLCGDLPIVVEEITIHAIMSINHAHARPVIQLGIRCEHPDDVRRGSILVMPAPNQVPAVKTTVTEHVERGWIETATVGLGEPVLRLGEIRPLHLAQGFALALGAPSLRQLRSLYL